MKKALSVLAGLLLLTFVSFSGIKAYKVNQAMKYINKCYFIERSYAVIAVTGYSLGKFALDGIYRIEGIVMFLPFNTVIKQSEFENEIIPITKEISCAEGEEE